MELRSAKGVVLLSLGLLISFARFEAMASELVDHLNDPPGNTGGITAPQACAKGLKAFTRTVHAPILRNACLNCHDIGGIGPAHSVADASISYTMIRSYVNFAQPEKSRIMNLVRSKHWTSFDPQAAGVAPEVMLAALEAWWEQGQRECPDSTTQPSVPLQLPKLGMDSYLTVRWPLDSWGTAFAGSRMQVEIKLLTAPTTTTKGAYILRSPRISTPQPGLSVDGITFFLNGKAQEGANGWSALGAKIAGHVVVGQDPFYLAPALSAQELILIQELEHGDQLAVALSAPQFGPAPQCADLSAFQKHILPAIKNNSCTTCHSSASSGLHAMDLDGSRRLDLSGDDAKVCAAVRERVNFMQSDASAFLLTGFLEQGGHPPALEFGNLTTELRTWMRTEK